MAQDIKNNQLSEILNEYLEELDFKLQYPDELMEIATGFQSLDMKLKDRY